MADSFDQFETLLLERVDPRVHDLCLETDDIAWTMMDTFQAESVAGRTTSRAGQTEGASGWEASWRIRISRAGRVAGASMTGNTLTQMGKSNILNVGQAADDTYLDPTLTPLRSYLPITMRLKAMKGSLTVNRKQLLADMAAQPLEEIGADHVEDVVDLVRHIFCALFWSEGKGIMGKFHTGGTLGVDGGGGILYDTIDGGTPFRFRVGQRYTAWAHDDTTTQRTASSPNYFRCVDIDTDTGAVGFESEAGSFTIEAGDYICAENMWDGTTDLAPTGIEKLLISTGTYPGTDYDVEYHRFLKSYVTGDEADLDYPTPENIALLVDKIVRSGKAAPSILVAEPSLWTYYAQLERQSGASYQVPQGATFLASGGVSGPVISHGDKTFVRLSSSMCRPGTVFGIAPETFKRFMPLGNKTINWVVQQGGMGGLKGIFRPVTSGSQLTTLSEAPFEVFGEFGQVDPRRCFIHKGLYSQLTATD